VFGVAMVLERLLDTAARQDGGRTLQGRASVTRPLAIDRPALNAKAQFVLEVIAGVSPSAAIRGPQIIERAEASLTHEDLEKSELTGRIIPKLKDNYGVETTEAGYRIRPSDRDWVLRFLDMA